MSQLTVHVWPLFYTSVGRTSTRVAWRPGMRLRDVIDPDWIERPALWVIVNGVRLQDLDAAVWPEDMVDVSERPAGPVGVLVIYAAYGFIAFKALSMFAKQKGPKKRDDKESAAYSFSGASNDRGEGQPKQYTYGEIVSAGTVINERVRARTSPVRSDLFQLISFGVGPITAIGQYTEDNNVAVPLSTDDTANPIPDGTELNGDVASNFRGVKMHVRMGTQTQKPCPGFEEIYTHYDVGKGLRQEATASADNFTLNADVDPALVAYNADGGQPTAGESDDAQSVWTAHGVKFTTSEEHDGGTAVISFPGGLYGISSSNGSLTDAALQVAIRYKRADFNGKPIDVGGDHGTGFVYVRPEQLFKAREQLPFSREYSWPFYDPLTYTAPTAGKCLDASTSADYGATAALNTGDVPATWAPGNSPDGFTVECWAWFSTLVQATGGTSTADKTRSLISWWSGNSTTGAGFSFGIKAFLYGNGVYAKWVWVPVGFAGCNGAVVEVRAPLGGTAPHEVYPPATTTERHHLTFTYAKNPADQPGVVARYRLYFDGILITQIVSASAGDQMAAPTTAQPIEFARSLVNSGWNVAADAKAFIDEPRIWDRELTAYEIEGSYAGGRGTYGVSSSDLVSGYHFDAVTNPSVDYSTYANTLTLNGGANAGTTPGHVDIPGVGTPLVSRWLVEILRLNVESNSTRIQDDSEWATFYGRLNRNLAYPNLALASMEVQANDQLNTSSPTRRHRIKGRPCPVWDGRSIISPRITWQWSHNTSWVAVSIAMEKQNPRRFPQHKIDWAAFLEFADYCDEFLYDGKGYVQTIDSASGSEPIADLRYDSTLLDGFGGIEILFRPGFRVPPHWIPGSFVQFDGLPTHANIDVDIGIGGVTDGWEIGTVVNASGGAVVTIRYDTATYGAPWTDGLDWTTATNPQALSGTVQGCAHRFEFDANYDTFGEFWDVLRAVLSSARAAPVLQGDVLSVSWARPRLPVGMITKANTMCDVDGDGNAVSSFTAERVALRGQTNMLELEIFDRDRGYKDSPVVVRGEGLEPNAPAASVISEAMQLFGVVRRSQSIRWGKFYLAVLAKLRTKINVRVGLDCIHLNPGDVVIMANDLMPWGKSGHVESSPATNQIVLDRSVVIPASPTSFVTVRIGSMGQTDTGGDYTQTLQVSSAAGTYAAGATITLSSTFVVSPANGDLWILWTTQFLAEVVSIKPIAGFRRQLELIEYRDDVFDGVDTLTTELQPGGMALGKG